MVTILAVFYKIAKKGFAITLCGLSCFSLWFELTMCLCSLNQLLGIIKLKIADPVFRSRRVPVEKRSKKKFIFDDSASSKSKNPHRRCK